MASETDELVRSLAALKITDPGYEELLDAIAEYLYNNRYRLPLYAPLNSNNNCFVNSSMIALYSCKTMRDIFYATAPTENPPPAIGKQDRVVWEMNRLWQEMLEATSKPRMRDEMFKAIRSDCMTCTALSRKNPSRGLANESACEFVHNVLEAIDDEYTTQYKVRTQSVVMCGSDKDTTILGDIEKHVSFIVPVSDNKVQDAIKAYFAWSPLDANYKGARNCVPGYFQQIKLLRPPERVVMIEPKEAIGFSPKGNEIIQLDQYQYRLRSFVVTRHPAHHWAVVREGENYYDYNDLYAQRLLVRAGHKWNEPISLLVYERTGTGYPQMD